MSILIVYLYFSFLWFVLVQGQSDFLSDTKEFSHWYIDLLFWANQFILNNYFFHVLYYFCTCLTSTYSVILKIHFVEILCTTSFIKRHMFMHYKKSIFISKKLKGFHKRNVLLSSACNESKWNSFFLYKSCLITVIIFYWYCDVSSVLSITQVFRRRNHFIAVTFFLCLNRFNTSLFCVSIYVLDTMTVKDSKSNFKSECCFH